MKKKIIILLIAFFFIGCITEKQPSSPSIVITDQPTENIVLNDNLLDLYDTNSFQKLSEIETVANTRIEKLTKLKNYIENLKDTSFSSFDLNTNKTYDYNCLFANEPKFNDNIDFKKSKEVFSYYLKIEKEYNNKLLLINEKLAALKNSLESDEIDTEKVDLDINAVKEEMLNTTNLIIKTNNLCYISPQFYEEISLIANLEITYYKIRELSLINQFLLDIKSSIDELKFYT